MHYNWHRYYDPSTGRYISADPIGFYGGDLNLYSYVWQDPVNWSDRLGLCVWDLCVGEALTATAIAGGIFYYGAPIAADIGQSLSNIFWNENTKDDEDGEEQCDVPTSPPEGLVENPDREGSWGVYEPNKKGKKKFKEKWRRDKGRPDEVKSGHGASDHIHIDGSDKYHPITKK